MLKLTSNNNYFVCLNCKTNVIICTLKNNIVQTKDLKINELQKYDIKDDNPVDDIHDICFLLNFLSNNLSFLQYLLLSGMKNVLNIVDIVKIIIKGRHSRYSTINKIDLLQYNSEENTEENNEQTTDKPKRKNIVTNGIYEKTTTDT